MLDLDVFSQRHRPRRAIAQVGTSIAMAGVMSGRTCTFQYAYGAGARCAPANFGQPAR